MAGALDVWGDCADQSPPANLSGALVRICDSQGQVATSRLVDDLGEQAVLESLLETVEPPQERSVAGLHPLLAAPFRYPPLRHGSRFGTRLEPGLFYGGLAIETVLAEAAYYRLVFFYGMAEPPPSGRLNSQHTVFGVGYRTRQGLRLQMPPWSRHAAAIASPVDYRVSQRLGAALRAGGVQAFEYPSARDPRGGINVALFTPAALAAPRPRYQQAWLCETLATAVRYAGAHPAACHAFPLADFLVGGALPEPAT